MACLLIGCRERRGGLNGQELLQGVNCHEMLFPSAELRLILYPRFFFLSLDACSSAIFSSLIM